MKEKLNKNLQEQRNVKSTMERHLADWQSVSALASLYDRFVNNMKKIEDHLVVIQQDLESMKARIPDLKKQLVDRLHAVSSALGVYATEEGDRKLIRLTGKRKSELKKLKSPELVKQAEKVVQAGKKLHETEVKEMKKAPKFHISGYGLTNNHLQKLQQALEVYQQALKDFGDAKTKVKQSKVKLAKKIQENNILLRRKLDRMILLFKEINPAFFEAYLQSRKPVVTPQVKTKAGKKVQAEPAAAKKRAASKKPVAAKKPAASTTKPAASTTKPAATTSKQAATKKPATSTTKPAATKKPATSTTKQAAAKKPAAGTTGTAATGKQTPPQGES